MHAWSECTHDLIYKPEKGPLTPQELQIIQELNNTVQLGEAQLEKLQNAIEGRTSEELRFNIVGTLRKFTTHKFASISEFKDEANKLLTIANSIPSQWGTYIKTRKLLSRLT
jgi:hypothetical protein